MRAAEIIFEEGACNIAAWNCLGGRSEHVEKVWENLGKVFAKFQSPSV